jgi:hypothetical protein
MILASGRDGRALLLLLLLLLLCQTLGFGFTSHLLRLSPKSGPIRWRRRGCFTKPSTEAFNAVRVVVV